jgi:hypothetical protein
MPGHMNPMLTVAQHLSSAGHNVTILTSNVFRDKVIAAGLDFVCLVGVANFDYRRLEDFFPDKRNLRGMDLTIHYFKHAFGATIPDQDQCIRQIMGEKAVDLILVDVPYLGTLPLLLGPKTNGPQSLLAESFLSSWAVSILGGALSQIRHRRDCCEARNKTASSRLLSNQPQTT